MRQTGESAFPPGLGNAFLFATFNAFSFQSILGSPMVLYAKSLGASATVLGIIAGMMPLLVIFQIPAASHINRIGYRRFVLAGWGTRVLFIFGMALVPLTGGFLDNGTRLALMLMLLYSVLLNVTQGLAPIGWGMLIDLLGERKPMWMGVCWNRFTVFFAAAALMFFVTFLLGRKLEEPKAASMEALLREILVQSPQRLWLRFWPRS